MPRHGLTTLGYVVMQAQQRVGQPCWRYWFDYVAEAEHDAYPHGAWHGNEVPYVFDNLRLTDPVRQYASEADLAFAAQVADYWAQFARLASGEQDAFRRGALAGVPARAGSPVAHWLA
ncbi:carboxylesterase family protein [Klebsiella pneumoniae]